MTDINLQTVLDNTLPDSQIINDVSQIIWEEAKGILTIEEDVIAIPKNALIVIVTKAFFKEYFDIGFGTCFTVQLAIGGIDKQECGILYPGICFATLHYNAQGELITSDIHKEMR
jgi:hypothetical protein